MSLEGSDETCNFQFSLTRFGRIFVAFVLLYFFSCFVSSSVSDRLPLWRLNTLSLSLSQSAAVFKVVSKRWVGGLSW